jgi:site-specific DNA-methyltransferase (adenine-specific)
MRLNSRNIGDGLDLLCGTETNFAAAVFFDPQYRALLDKMAYGNQLKQVGRHNQVQMSAATIADFAIEIARIVRPSGHVFQWVDKLGIINYAAAPTFALDWVVDAITWDKVRIGLGYRTRKRSEHLLIHQKPPRRAKGIWTDHGIPDVWAEKQPKDHPHAKPIDLQRRLVLAVTKPGDLIVDPCAGSFNLLEICRETGRDFLGCDIVDATAPLREAAE